MQLSYVGYGLGLWNGRVLITLLLISFPIFRRVLKQQLLELSVDSRKRHVIAPEARAMVATSEGAAEHDHEFSAAGSTEHFFYGTLNVDFSKAVDLSVEQAGEEAEDRLVVKGHRTKFFLQYGFLGEPGGSLESHACVVRECSRHRRACRWEREQRHHGLRATYRPAPGADALGFQRASY